MKRKPTFLKHEGVFGGASSISGAKRRSPKAIREDLESLVHIDDYLMKISKPGQYWLVKDKTETFNEMANVERAIERSDRPLRDKGRLKTSLHNIIRNGQATHQLIRSVNRALGPVRPRPGGTQPNTAAIDILINNAPDAADLELDPSQSTEEAAQATVMTFQNAIQVRDASQTPFTNADRAKTTLIIIAQSILGGEVAVDRFGQLKDILDEAKNALTACYDHMEEQAGDVESEGL